MATAFTFGPCLPVTLFARQIWESENGGSASGEAEPSDKVWEIADAPAGFIWMRRGILVSPWSKNEKGDEQAEK